MAKPVETLREKKAHFRLEEIVSRYTTLHGSGPVLTGKCPIHGGRHNSFAVYVHTQTWQCFSARCDRGGDVFDFVGCMLFGTAWNSRDKAQFTEMLRTLDGTGAGSPARPQPTTEPPGARRLPGMEAPGPDAKPGGSPDPHRVSEPSLKTRNLLRLASTVYQGELLSGVDRRGSAYEYLREQRGFSHDTIVRHAIGYAGGKHLLPALERHGYDLADGIDARLFGAEKKREWFAGRIVFCERDKAGRVLHLIGRRFATWLGEGAPKYLSLSEIYKPIYGYARLDRRATDRPVFLVEGPPDQVTLNQWGYDALANLGTRLTHHHAALLAGLRRPLVVVPNNDDDPGKGLAAAVKWLDLIGHGLMLKLPADVKDVNELNLQPDGATTFRKLVRTAGLSAQRNDRERFERRV